MTNYNESVWRNLGHPAFDNDYLLAIDEVEWWEIQELPEKNEETNDIIEQ
jgi:hypothetical protein